MDAISPTRRRRTLSAVDSTPMLMSARSEPETSDILDDGGRILLTPSREMSHRYLDDADVYEAVGTPPAQFGRSQPPRLSNRSYMTSKKMSDRYILGASSVRQLQATNSHRSGAPASSAQRQGMSRWAVRMWLFVANSVLALCLVAGIGIRVNAISTAYLLLLCYGILNSFASAPLVIASIIVSALASIGHVVVGVLADGKRSGHSGEDVLRVLGFVQLSETKTVLTHPMVDGVILVYSLVHFFVVLRRLKLPIQEEAFDLFDAGVHLLDEEDTQPHLKMTMFVHRVELLATMLLFLTAFSVPAAATGVFYLILVYLLISWTIYAKRISAEEFIRRDIKRDFLMGPVVAKLLLAWTLLTILTWYVLLFPIISSSDLGKNVLKYAGFADFKTGDVKWEYYLLAAFIALLYMCLAKVVNLHSSLQKREGSSRHLDVSTAFFPADGSHQSPKLNEGLLPPQPPSSPAEIARRLRDLPFTTRVFLRDGGLLLASAAAIFWCVSYPSYGNAPMMGWALATLGLYGLLPAGPLVFVLIVYATALSMTEYAVNLTWDFLDGDYTIYGLKQFQYPFLDLGVHNFCLIVIYASMRTRWRYEQVVKASRLVAAANPADTTTPDEDRSSMDVFRHMVGVRRTAQASWKDFLPLWFQDAKQVFLTHLGPLVLLTIVAVVLSTRESFLQAGYLLFAMLCIVFFKHRQKLWRLLLVYALSVCLASFIRNVDCTQDSRLDLIGLICYSEDAVTWGALWPTLFSAQLVIILQIVFQLVIYVANEKDINKRIQTIDMSHQNPIFFISRIAVEVDNLFRVFGSIVCYVVILAVLFKFEVISSGSHTTVLGGVQLIMLLIVVGGHLGKFKTAPRTSLRLKLLWSLFLIVEVVILLSRYVFHFDDVSNYFEKHVFTKGFMSARHFGLEKKSSKSTLSGVFLYLAPTALIIILSFWQLSSIMKPVRPYEVFVAGRSRFIDGILFWLDTIRQMLIAFSTTMLVLVTMSVAISYINAIGAAYVLVLVVGRPLSSWQKLWFPLFWVSSIAIGASYAYQLYLFGGVKSAGDGYHHIDLEDNASWFGVDRLVSGDFSKRTNLWRLNTGPLLVIMMCFLQRIAQYFEEVVKKKRSVYKTQGALIAASKMASSSVLPGSGVSSPSGVSSSTPPPESTPLPASGNMDTELPSVPGGQLQLEAFVDPNAMVPEEEADFFSLLRDFCIEYASSASINVVMLLLMASSFLHRDVVSIAYLVIVYGMMYATPQNVCKAWLLLATLLSIIIIAEYAVIVWLPPVAGVVKDDIPPWKHLSADEEQWLCLNNQHKWALLADFMALLAAYMLPNSQRIVAQQQRIEVRVQSVTEKNGQPSFYRQQTVTDDDDWGSFGNTKRVQLAEPEFMQKTRQSAWHALVYFFILGWLPITLVVVFICGASHGGIASFVYIGSAVWMLYRLDEARLPESPWIHNLRKFNWAHLFVMVIISAPYVKDSLSRCLVGEKSNEDGDVCLSVEELIGLHTEDVPVGIIAIFVLIAIQCEMLATPTYEDVCQYIQLEKLQAPVRQELIVRSFYRRRTAQWFAMKKDKSAALQRLKMIVSKLVHKVEELMDIAMGLHYNLPPMAPSKPRVVEKFQNAVTIEWDPPQESIHKIRYYRITRQQYPSQTLLGDFGDVVEVKGDVKSMTIEGLRPGTSYQFKVAAVSRMGEGPFSSASDPVSTYPLNLNGTCTAGWMKYRRENVIKSWFSTLISWLQPKYLHRYVVMDNRALVFYKNEEIALRHRSKKRRKKIKTSFAWKDVISLRLSDNKVQFDDVSPMLFCFELIVHQEGQHADLKYIFQADVAKDFDRLLSALAFAVPRFALDESILLCLREKKLPEPDMSQADYDAADEAGSEMSSVTGDESSFGDAEDAEFDEQPRPSWRIPIYRVVYDLQDAAMQAETTYYDADDQVEPTIGEIVSVTVNAIRSRTATWCYGVMILAFARQADVLNFVYILCTFGYLGLESPRPSSQSWVLLLKYTCFIVLLRYVFQLPLFCQGLSATGYYYPSIQPLCGAPKNSVVFEKKPIQPAVVFGIYKYDGVAVSYKDDIFEGLQWNFYVALAILWHRRELIIRGLWVDAREVRQPNDRAPSEMGSRRHINGSEISSRDSIDESFNFGGGVSRFVARQTPASQPEPRQSERTFKESMSIDAVDSEPTTQGLELQLAEQILQELEAEEEAERVKSKEQVNELENDDTPERRDSGQPESSNQALVEAEQVEIEDTIDASQVHQGKQKLSWLEAKYPQVDAFFKRVVCSPPVHWDKDIHAAISGSKPGRSYYGASLSIMIFASVFAVLFFKQIAGQSSSTIKAGQLQSNSMVSGYLVLIVFLQLCYIIWDRAAYVCGSLKSKIVLQYSYIILLHMCLWLILPSHIDEYFQDRPALVIFYLMHCLYLWFGALQIRYGYPVFKGSRFNYSQDTAYSKAKERVFPLVMMAPFLFEMRALLDYVCTKTSLSWQHWVLLEDTAAHLFNVKLEMRGRVEEAEVLQGKKRQPFGKKLMSAGVMLLFLLLCLIGPLLLFSSANPSTTKNKVTSTNVVFGIEDSRGTINQLYTGTDINSPDYEGDQIADGAAMQRITYDTFSRDVWSSSPPNVNRLVGQLNSTEKLSWIMTISFVRPGPTNYQTVETTQRVPLSSEDRLALIPMIQLKSTTSTEKEASGIQIASILPPILELSATGSVFKLSTRLRAVNISKHSVDGSSWWSVEPQLHNATSGTNANDREFCDETTPFCLIAVSDNIVQGLTTLGIGSYGITAVYVFVLVTVGSAVKGFFRGALFQIQYSELPDPDDVLELVEGIYIARSERYVGHLKDEVRIFETLIRVLRSPETLSKVTGTNVIHIPKAKEKVD